MAVSRLKPVYSKISVESQAVLPREVRERLGVAPGDRLRYIFDDMGVRIEKGAGSEDDDPFAVFAEWGSAKDDAAYGRL